MSLVENIRSLCKCDNTSVPKLEKEMGFGNGAIYNWDKNSPSIDKLQKVANHFNVSVDELLGRTDDDEEYKKTSKNPDIRRIARAGENLTDEQAKELVKLAERLYPEAFDKE